MVAVEREHLLDTAKGKTPRVQHKLTLCLNPQKPVVASCAHVTGLDDSTLAHQPQFDMEVFAIIDKFLKVQTQPLCLVAHNGLNYDFYLLRNELRRLNLDHFSCEVLCADSYFGFYYMEERKKKLTTSAAKEVKEPPSKRSRAELLISTNINENDEISNKFMQAVNETTPKKQNVTKRTFRAPDDPSKIILRKKFPGCHEKGEFQLSNLYSRLLNKGPPLAHRAENDCLMLLEIAAYYGKQLATWMDANNISFSEIEPVDLRLG